jgi:hypothetical protein
VERAAEELTLDEPVVARHKHEKTVDWRSGVTGPAHGFQGDVIQGRGVEAQAIEGICANPLRDEPDPAIVRAVQRFGLVGLVACALWAAAARWWKSPAG